MRCDPHERVESDAERASPCPTGEGRSPTGGDACAGLAWDSERSPCGSPPREAHGATPPLGCSHAGMDRIYTPTMAEPHEGNRSGFKQMDIAPPFMD